MAAPRVGRVFTDAKAARDDTSHGPRCQLYGVRFHGTVLYTWDENKMSATGRLAEAAGCTVAVYSVPDHESVALVLDTMTTEEKGELLAALRAKIRGSR